MMFILLIFFLIDNSRSLEWNCVENKHVLISNEQCTITVEYLSIYQERQVCLAHTLAIKTLPPPSFSSNYSMKNFQINFCQLLSLNQLPFTLPSSVEKLDLSYNLLSTFTLGFPLPSYLKYLHLDHNPNLIDINFGQNRVQEKLISLTLRHNKQIQLSSLPKSLIQLDLTDCNLLQSSILTLLRSLTKLTHLSLGENQLERLPVLDERISLEYLNLSNNHLTFLEEKWLYKHLQILDLRFNQIKSLDFFQDQLKINNQTQSQVLQLFLHGNPLTCDCWLSSIIDSPAINITDYSLLQCNSHSILNMSQGNFLCSYTRHCTSDCTCCDFEACDCHSICPSDCLCSHNTFWSYHLVKCRERNFFDIHHLLPETVTELNYEGNHIEELKSFVFMGKTLLTKLNLAKNNLRDLTNETFCPALNLREINLSYNPNLMSIVPNVNDLFGCLKYLQYIILSKEQINEDEQISSGWTIDYNDELIRLIRIAPQSSSSITTTPGHPLFKPSTIFSIYHQELFTSSTIIEHNQTLLLIVFFLLLFVLLFCLLLISLAICRRKLRHRLTTELQRQQSHHYCYHTNIHPPSIKIPESNGTSAANESLYEQLPSLSSDSEQPFLCNDKKLNAPALPPYPPTFRHYHCYRAQDFQYTINPNYSQHQCLGNHHEYVLSQSARESVFVPSTLCRCTDTYIYPNVPR